MRRPWGAVKIPGIRRQEGRAASIPKPSPGGAVAGSAVVPALSASPFKAAPMSFSGGPPHTTRATAHTVRSVVTVCQRRWSGASGTSAIAIRAPSFKAMGPGTSGARRHRRAIRAKAAALLPCRGGTPRIARLSIGQRGTDTWDGTIRGRARIHGDVGALPGPLTSTPSSSACGAGCDDTGVRRPLGYSGLWPLPSWRAGW